MTQINTVLGYSAKSSWQCSVVEKLCNGGTALNYFQLKVQRSTEISVRVWYKFGTELKINNAAFIDFEQIVAQVSKMILSGSEEAFC